MRSAYTSDKRRMNIMKARAARQMIRDFNHLMQYSPLPLWYIMKEIGQKDEIYFAFMYRRNLENGIIRTYIRNDGEVMLDWNNESEEE